MDDLNIEFQRLEPEHKILVQSMMAKLTQTILYGGSAIVIVDVGDGKAEMMHVGKHEPVLALMQVGYARYMFECAPREYGAVMQ